MTQHYKLINRSWIRINFSEHYWLKYEEICSYKSVLGRIYCYKIGPIYHGLYSGFHNLWYWKGNELL